jgi:hypothetical protein
MSLRKVKRSMQFRTLHTEKLRDLSTARAGKALRKSPLGKPRRRWEDTFQIDLRGTGEE